MGDRIDNDPIGRGEEPSSDRELRDQLDQLLHQAAHALESLDGGDVHAARRALSDLIETHVVMGAEIAAEAPEGPDQIAGWDPAPPPAPAEPLHFGDDVADDELEMAFAEAESDASEMHDVNRVAEQVLEAADRESSFDADVHSVFATETMADLLEGQGDAAAAQSIRAALHMEVPAADEERVFALADAHLAFESSLEVAKVGGRADESLEEQLGTLATLERWLTNVRRDVA